MGLSSTPVSFRVIEIDHDWPSHGPKIAVAHKRHHKINYFSVILLYVIWIS